MAVMDITEKLAALRARVSAATQAAGRAGTSVMIVAVSKGQPAAAVAAAHAAGLADFGENYLQEALAKMATGVPETISWHYIGNLQANKTRTVAERFAWAQTVTNVHIAERLSRQRPFHAGDLQVCIQLRPADGSMRAGVAEEELAALATRIAGLPRLRLRGLMFMPLADLGEAELGAEFARAAQALRDLNGLGLTLDTLSMGMSGDLEQAIRAGSTLVRVGTALFGPRAH